MWSWYGGVEIFSLPNLSTTGGQIAQNYPKNALKTPKIQEQGCCRGLYSRPFTFSENFWYMRMPMGMGRDMAGLKFLISKENSSQGVKSEHIPHFFFKKKMFTPTTFWTPVPSPFIAMAKLKSYVQSTHLGTSYGCCPKFSDTSVRG